MIIELYCAGACRDNGKPTQLAGGGVVLRAHDDKDVKERNFSYGFGNSTANLADVQAVRLALASIAPQYRRHKAILHIISNYVLSMLAKDGPGFKREPVKNSEEISDLRRRIGRYSDLEVIHAKADDPLIKRAKDLAKRGLDTQQNTDSKTLSVMIGGSNGGRFGSTPPKAT